MVENNKILERWMVQRHFMFLYSHHQILLHNKDVGVGLGRRLMESIQKLHSFRSDEDWMSQEETKCGQLFIRSFMIQ